MDSQSLYTTSSSNNIVNNSSTVVVKDVVSFKKDGQVIGKLDAEIDFKDLAPELHVHAIQLLQQMPRCLHLPSERTAEESQVVDRAVEPVGSVWQKIKNYLGA